MGSRAGARREKVLESYTFSMLSPFNVKYAICYYYLLLYSQICWRCCCRLCATHTQMARRAAYGATTNMKMRISPESGRIKGSDYLSAAFWTVGAVVIRHRQRILHYRTSHALHKITVQKGRMSQWTRMVVPRACFSRTHTSANSNNNTEER